MRILCQLKRLIIGILALSGSNLLAQGQIRLSGEPDRMDFFLHTVDNGPRFAELYGHLQIRIIDSKTSGDYMMSWGLFDYAAPNFALNFYKGRLNYAIGIFDTRRTDATYRYDDRTVWQNKLLFSKQQKLRLLEKMSFDLKPENRNYLYQYFWDNCSTRPRNFIDYALNGEFKKKYENVDSGMTWRTAVRLHQSLIPLSGLVLELLMNSNLDVNMTKWEHMFLPQKLREGLVNFPQLDDDFAPIEGTSILGDTETYYEGTKYEIYPKRDYILFFALFISSILVSLLLSKLKKGGCTRSMGFFSSLWFLLGGCFGLLMPISWWFSDHIDLKHNANILLFWPLDWLLILPGFYLLINKPIPGGLLGRIIRYYLYGHVLAFVGMIVMSFFGLIDQNVTVVLATYGVVCLVYWFYFLRKYSMKDELRANG